MLSLSEFRIRKDKNQTARRFLDCCGFSKDKPCRPHFFQLTVLWGGGGAHTWCRGPAAASRTLPLPSFISERRSFSGEQG